VIKRWENPARDKKIDIIDMEYRSIKMFSEFKRGLIAIG